MRDKQTILKKKKYLYSRHYFWIWESTCLWTAVKGRLIFFKSELNTKSFRRKWQPTSVFLPGESHGQEAGRLQSMGSQQLDTTEWLTCMQSLVETFTEIQIAGSLGGGYCQHRNKWSKAPLARTFWEKLFPCPFLFPTWPWIIIACPVHTEGQETAKPSRIAQKQ